MLAVYLGIIAGGIHVLSGPDHLASITSLSRAAPRRPWILGFVWGVGHTSGFWMVSLLALGASQLMPVEPMAVWSDTLASAGVAALGLWSLMRLWLTDRSGVETADLQPALSARAACGLGVLHGLAGSSHYLGVLPALAFSSAAEGLAYLIAFGAATILLMVAFSWGLGSALGRLANWGGPQYRWALTGCAAVAVAVGVGGIFF